MALTEVLRPPFIFNDESVIIYKGFRVSYTTGGTYSWKDVRFNDYYEDVDPLITEKILDLGFVKTLTLCMIHSDQDRLTQFNRRVININKEIEHWVVKSTEIYVSKNIDILKIDDNNCLSLVEKNKLKDKIIKEYNKQRSLFERKRRLLKNEKDKIKNDQDFYTNRINNFNRK